MSDRPSTLQDRVKLLDTVRTRTPRRGLLALLAILAVAIAGVGLLAAHNADVTHHAWTEVARASAAAHDLKAAIDGERNLSILLLIVLAAVAIFAGALGEAFLRWKDGFTKNYVELAVRRHAEFEEASDGIVILNNDGCIEAVNATAEKLIGRSRETLARLPVAEIMDLAPDGEGDFVGRLEAANGPLTAGSVREVSVRRPDGVDLPADVTIRAMHMPDGRYIGVYIRDISDRKRVEQLKDEFVSTVSHELRTPLTSIAGSLGLLAGGAGGALPDGPARLISIAHSNCQRLIRLINDILDVEKIESGKMKFDMAPITLDAAAERSIDAVRGYAAQLGVTLDLDWDGEALAIRGDVDRLVQVGANLISNAVKFSQAEGHVVVTVRQWGRIARLSVRDDGPGIPDEFRTRIFTKFAQANSSDTRQRGGTGLGLVIAKEIVDRHGGRLWFESEAGKGACFHVDLPLAEALESASTGAAPGAPRLLVCEDDPDVASILRRTLERDGFAVDVVQRAADARAVLGVRNSYRALLLDLILPDGDGLALIGDLRSNSQSADLPIVVVSARAEAGREAAGATALNVVDWMEKPIDVTRLRRAVAAALARSPGGKRPTILHVDDDPDILQVTATALATCGQVVSVESLGAARAFLATRTPDLVILDLALGDGSGLELLPSLNDAAGKPIPVLIFSAHDTDKRLLGRVAEVMTKSRTTLPHLADAVRRLIDPPLAPTPSERLAS